MGKIVVDGCGTPVSADDMKMIEEIGAELGLEVTEGKVTWCTTCQMFDCVCEIRKTHKEKCRFRTAMECPVGFECKHGSELCPECDKCDCATL